MSYIIVRYLHLLAITGLVGTLVIENGAIARKITGEDARNLAKVDGFYGLCAGLVLLFGLVLWLWIGKPSEFYTQNPVFLLKVGLFIIVGLLSIYPTVFLIKHRKSQAESIDVPAAIIWLMRSELILLVIIPILAILMARGVGLNNP